MHEFDDSIRKCTRTVIAIKLNAMWQQRSIYEKHFFSHDDVSLKSMLKTLEYPHYTTIVLHMESHGPEGNLGLI